MQSAMSLVPLSMVASGETAQLKVVHSGEPLQKRLADLGLNIGTFVRVVQCDSTGQMILAFRNDARLAIGRGVAQKIMVSLGSGEDVL